MAVSMSIKIEGKMSFVPGLSRRMHKSLKLFKIWQIISI